VYQCARVVVYGVHTPQGFGRDRELLVSLQQPVVQVWGVTTLLTW
jgi:hypothetical protein